MSKKFHAINRKTGERWKKYKNYDKQYLVMYDSGYLAVVTEDCHTDIYPLDPKIWKTVKHENIKRD